MLAADEVITASSRRSRRPAQGDRVLVLPYPATTSNPRTKVAFNESTVLKTFGVFTDLADRLGISRSSQRRARDDVGVNPFVTPMTTNPTTLRTPT
jgi:hypothetical protein